MSAIKGHLDGLDDGCVVGWAVSEVSETNCVITVIDMAGSEVGRGRASRMRPDLAVLGLGRTNFAFRIHGLDLSESGTYRVLADGVELRNSPITVAPGFCDGFLEVANGIISGWVCPRNKNDIVDSVKLLDDSSGLIAEMQTLSPQQTMSGGSTRFYFSYEVPQFLFGKGERKVTAVVSGRPFAACSFDYRLIGNVESINSSEVVGWIYSPDVVGRTFRMDVLIDGRLTGTVDACLNRSDVLAHHPSAGKPGFIFRLPVCPKIEETGVVVTLAHHGQVEGIFGTPVVIGSTAAAVVAVRKIASIALQADLSLTPQERALLHAMTKDYLGAQRERSGFVEAIRSPVGNIQSRHVRLNIIVPVYRSVPITETCLASVIERMSEADRLVIVNDRSPDEGMAAMLSRISERKNVRVLTNAQNIGFIRSCNRAITVCNTGDILLLNSDTVVFDHVFDELTAIAQSSESIGTVTALSSNATMFSYPHSSIRKDELNDISWSELASVAFDTNKGLCTDVPTGHGFCLLIKREVLNQVHQLNEAFGRGYGEENELCARSADLGFRNVAALGVLVQHKESVSFVEDKRDLLAANIARLEAMYPEYTPLIMGAEQADPLRRGRWPLDVARLARASQLGTEFALVVCNKLGGGTKKAVEALEDYVGYGDRVVIRCESDESGGVQLRCESPRILAVFSVGEAKEFNQLLININLSLVVVHQLLGLDEEFIEVIADTSARVRSIAYLHDFYPLCPRVTMIDAVGEFCNVAESTVCDRCVRIGGAHEASRLVDVKALDHRIWFEEVLGHFEHLVVPSKSAAHYFSIAGQKLSLSILPHPEKNIIYPAQIRNGKVTNIVLLGALGPHKGSAQLLELASRARLTHPELQFIVIGHTNIDDKIKKLQNVTLYGRYDKDILARIVGNIDSCVALFLSMWPETYSYTLSEAVSFGFFPVVPDLGAPAERVRLADFGAVYPFPFSAQELLGVLERVPELISSSKSQPSCFTDNRESLNATRILYGQSAS